MGSLETLSKECRELINTVYTKVGRSKEEVEIEFTHISPDSVQAGYLINQLQTKGYELKLIPTTSGIKFRIKS